MFGNNDNQDSQQPDDITMTDTPVVEPDTADDTASAPVVADEPSASEPDEDIVTKAVESSTNADDDLLTIKQQALEQLTPLVGHLDQSPEERFRTTMMMIQASDNQSLVKDAYEAAKQIGDEKAKAQALLDIVNEINYFTQPKN